MAQRREISIEPRGKRGILDIRFTGPNGRRIQKSSGTTDRRLAEEFASQLWTEAYREQRLGDRPRKNWEDAVTAWVTEHAHKRSLKKDQANLRWLHPHLAGTRLDKITAQTIRNIAAVRASEPANKRAKAEGEAPALTSPATVNRMLALLRSVLRYAVTLDWLDRAPAIKLRKEKADRLRWLTRDEAELLLAELPEHLAAAARFALATGLREQNVLRLEWTQVDLARRIAWVHADQAKGGVSLSVPLNAAAMVTLRGQEGAHARWCFPGPEESNPDGSTVRSAPPVRASNKSWYSAVKRAGLAPLRWHDLRHTWASWHVQAGTPLEVLKELGGWKSLAMVMRYAHLSPGHLAKYADQLSAPVPVAADQKQRAMS